MRTVTQTFLAGETHRWGMMASYFRLMEITSGNYADIRILKNGATVTEANQIDAGYGYKAPEKFDGVEIYCPTACTLKFAISDGAGTYDRTIGSVAISGGVSVVRGATLAHAAPVTVGTIAVVALAAAAGTKAAYFRADPANTVPICLGGSAVGPSNAVVRLNPGDIYIDDTIAEAAWYAYAASAGQLLQVMRGS